MPNLQSELTECNGTEYNKMAT